jgi:hypothetical protein
MFSVSIIFIFLLSFQISAQIPAPIREKIVEADWLDPDIICCQKKPDGSTYW